MESHHFLSLLCVNIQRTGRRRLGDKSRTLSSSPCLCSDPGSATWTIFSFQGFGEFMKRVFLNLCLFFLSFLVDDGPSGSVNERFVLLWSLGTFCGLWTTRLVLKGWSGTSEQDRESPLVYAASQIRSVNKKDNRPTLGKRQHVFIVDKQKWAVELKYLYFLPQSLSLSSVLGQKVTVK